MKIGKSRGQDLSIKKTSRRSYDTGQVCKTEVVGGARIPFRKYIQFYNNNHVVFFVACTATCHCQWHELRNRPTATCFHSLMSSDATCEQTSLIGGADLITCTCLMHNWHRRRRILKDVNRRKKRRKQSSSTRSIFQALNPTGTRRLLSLRLKMSEKSIRQADDHHQLHHHRTASIIILQGHGTTHNMGFMLHQVQDCK